MSTAEAALAPLLLGANRTMERAMMAAAAKAGLDMLRPGHLTVLRVLDPGPEGTRVSEMAREAHVSRQAIQQIIADLERLGLVESIADHTDGRARLVRYTPVGRRGYRRCMKEFGRLELDIEGELGAGPTRSLRRSLAVIAAGRF